MYLYKRIDFPRAKFYWDVVFKMFIVLPLISFPFLFAASKLSDGLVGVLIIATIAVLVITPSFWFVGLSKGEREPIKTLVLSKIQKRG